MRALSAQDFACLRDDNLFHAGVYRLKRVFQFGNHAALDDASVYILLESLAVYLWNDTLVVIFIPQDAFFFKAEHQGDVEVAGQRFGRFARDGVGIGVEDMPLFVVRQWGKNRDDPLLDE